jgi:hypothetical protein
MLSTLFLIASSIRECRIILEKAVNLTHQSLTLCVLFDFMQEHHQMILTMRFVRSVAAPGLRLNATPALTGTA